MPSEWDEYYGCQLVLTQVFMTKITYQYHIQTL